MGERGRAYYTYDKNVTLLEQFWWIPPTNGLVYSKHLISGLANDEGIIWRGNRFIVEPKKYEDMCQMHERRPLRGAL